MPDYLPKWLHYLAVPPKMNGSSCSMAFLPAIDVVRVLDFSHPKRCLVVSCCCFNLHFPDDKSHCLFTHWLGKDPFLSIPKPLTWCELAFLCQESITLQSKLPDVALGIPGARGFLPTRRGPLAPAARPDSWIPPAAPAPPGPRGASGRGPDSRCLACGIFLNQGSNPCPLHWQVDSQPWHHQGSPWYIYFKYCSVYMSVSNTQSIPGLDFLISFMTHYYLLSWWETKGWSYSQSSRNGPGLVEASHSYWNIWAHAVEWVSSACVPAQLLSCVQFFATPWTVACQVPLSMGFPKQEYWSELPFPSLGELPDPGIEPMSPALQAYSLPLSHQEGPLRWL